jgi:hypothetical protein
MRPVRPLLAAVLAVASLVTVGAVAQVDRRVASATPSGVPPPDGTEQRVSSTFRPVAAPGPCLVVEGPPTIVFGRGEFGGAPVVGTGATTVRTCTPTAGVTVRASVGPARVGGAPVWQPAPCSATPCALDVDEFAYFLSSQSLSATPVDITLGQPLTHTLHLPPPGSAGGGERVRLRVDLLGVGP